MAQQRRRHEVRACQEGDPCLPVKLFFFVITSSINHARSRIPLAWLLRPVQSPFLSPNSSLHNFPAARSGNTTIGRWKFRSPMCRIRWKMVEFWSPFGGKLGKGLQVWGCGYSGKASRLPYFKGKIFWSPLLFGEWRRCLESGNEWWRQCGLVLFCLPQPQPRPRNVVVTSLGNHHSRLKSSNPSFKAIYAPGWCVPRTHQTENSTTAQGGVLRHELQTECVDQTSVGLLLRLAMNQYPARQTKPPPKRRIVESSGVGKPGSVSGLTTEARQSGAP